MCETTIGVPRSIGYLERERRRGADRKMPVVNSTPECGARRGKACAGTASRGGGGTSAGRDHRP